MDVYIYIYIYIHYAQTEATCRVYGINPLVILIHQKLYVLALLAVLKNFFKLTQTWAIRQASVRICPIT